MQNVNMGVAHSCLKYGVFITTRFDGMRICIQDKILSAMAKQISILTPFRLEVG